MPGPRRQAEHLRLIRGGRKPGDRPQVRVDAMPAETPTELDGNDEAIAEWQRVIVPAIEAGLIAVVDRAAAIAHCELWALWRAQVAAANSEPAILCVGPSKYPTVHPLRGLCNSTHRLLQRVDAALGLSPVTRSRIPPAPRPPDPLSPVEAFKRRKPGSRE